MFCKTRTTKLASSPNDRDWSVQRIILKCFIYKSKQLEIELKCWQFSFCEIMPNSRILLFVLQTALSSSSCAQDTRVQRGRTKQLNTPPAPNILWFKYTRQREGRLFSCFNAGEMRHQEGFGNLPMVREKEELNPDLLHPSLVLLPQDPASSHVVITSYFTNVLSSLSVLWLYDSVL